MMEPMAEPMADLSNARVFSREALETFTRTLVEQFAPEKVILLDLRLAELLARIPTQTSW